MQQLIDALATGVLTALLEIRTRGRTLKKRAGDILPYFERPGTSNGPTEARSKAAWSTCVDRLWASGT